MKSFFASGLIIAVSALFFAPGCAEDSEPGRTVDCASICSKYSECVTSIDVVACTSECEDKADADLSYQESASACDVCIDDKACKEAESCWTSCPSMPATQS